jgi:uncharacterized membrane protein
VKSTADGSVQSGVNSCDDITATQIIAVNYAFTSKRSRVKVSLYYYYCNTATYTLLLLLMLLLLLLMQLLILVLIIASLLSQWQCYSK